FWAHFSVLHDERMEPAAHPVSPKSPQSSTSICLKITFSGSTDLESISCKINPHRNTAPVKL
ncbi:MAG: hypothetical protein ABSG96_26675, partial [Terracidiphilus sp.]